MTPQDLQQPKLIVILGQTATGKTSLGIELAKQFRGEIISADSRQVYRGMDIGTAKVTPEEMQGIPHHLIDITDPRERFSVAQFRTMTLAAIEDIHARGNLPILVGGTGFYIQSIVDGIVLPEVPANPAFRSELKSRSTEDLYKILTQKDPRRAATIDPQNKVRLVRALEIIDTLGVVPTPEAEPTDLDILQIGLQVPDTILKERIHARNVLRINNGLLEEVQSLHDNGLSWERMEELGLEYRYVSHFLRGEIDTSESLIEILDTKIWQFAKRQRTWFQRDERIHWSNPVDIKTPELVENFLEN